MEQSVTGPPFDVDDLIPELAVHARRTTVLSPRSGSPGVGESSLGGPLLWPADEPWPSCAQRGHHVPPDDKNSTGTVPMVPVVQLFARDIPELPFPEGTDVLQLLWCPLIHPDDQAYAALPKLYWRDEAAALATGVLRDIPAPQPGEYDEEFVPSPCTVSPPRWSSTRTGTSLPTGRSATGATAWNTCSASPRRKISTW
ncbi:hypothetical protein [Streptomyces sp. NBC_00989]|uniref:hypothetical protein n=1 Tax=Streptomyces sp. NBC_00989 TaxID=2903705 RepID=UPI0038672C28|nr:hypothetical protein OG714_35365 [Streptomyces sp. NBC_00989]